MNNMSPPDYLGTPGPRMVLYLPHRPTALEQLVLQPSAQALVDANSNHWRKIVNLLAKIASPEADGWRQFRDDALFQHTALCFSPTLVSGTTWHWIGGKENVQRFADVEMDREPLTGAPDVAIDYGRRLLITPYPDYRQLNNALVAAIRLALGNHGFYPG